MLITHISSAVTLSISSAELVPRVGDQISSLVGLRIGGPSGLELGDQISGLLIPRAGGSSQWPSGPWSWGAFGPKNQGIKSADPESVSGLLIPKGRVQCCLPLPVHIVAVSSLGFHCANSSPMFHCANSSHRFHCANSSHRFHCANSC